MGVWAPGFNPVQTLTQCGPLRSEVQMENVSVSPFYNFAFQMSK